VEDGWKYKGWWRQKRTMICLSPDYVSHAYTRTCTDSRDNSATDALDQSLYIGTGLTSLYMDYAVKSCLSPRNLNLLY